MVSMQETRDDIAATRKSSKPKNKRKSSSAGGEREGFRGKKFDGKISLVAAILEANNLTLKTKLADMEAMFKSLKEGLEQCFLYGHDSLPCKINVDKIHLASNSLKYCVFIEKRKEQMHSRQSNGSPSCIAFLFKKH